MPDTTVMDLQLEVAALRRYEKTKLTILVVLLIVLVALSSITIVQQQGVRAGQRTANATLVIMRCAVDRTTSTYNGKARTKADAQAVFELCVKAGGPKP